MARIIFNEDEVRNPNITRDIAMNWLNIIFGGGEVEIIRNNKKEENAQLSDNFVIKSVRVATVSDRDSEDSYPKVELEEMGSFSGDKEK